MSSILVTGSSGFVGKNLINAIEDKFEISTLPREKLISGEFDIKYDYVIHLAGLAHDTKKTLNDSEYFIINTDLTIMLWKKFIDSSAKVFIYVSSIKCVRDNYDGELTEETIEMPKTPYGKSKLLAERGILNTVLPDGKKFFILRPSLIYGNGNKGNLNLLINYVEKRMPWFLGNFSNQRSLCSIQNFNFIIENLINRNDIDSGIYNVCDSDFISTNQIIELIGESLNKPIFYFPLPKFLVVWLAKVGDLFNLPFNSEILIKLTGNFKVSNNKLLNSLKNPLPVNTLESLYSTLKSK